MIALFLWGNAVDFAGSSSEQPKCCWTTIVSTVMLLHSWAFDCCYYKVFNQILKFVTLSGYCWARLQALQQIEQKRDVTIWEYHIEVSVFCIPTILNNGECLQVANMPFCWSAISLSTILWIGENATSFLGWNKIEKLGWFPYPSWAGGCQNW